MRRRGVRRALGSNPRARRTPTSRSRQPRTTSPGAAGGGCAAAGTGRAQPAGACDHVQSGWVPRRERATGGRGPGGTGGVGPPAGEVAPEKRTHLFEPFYEGYGSSHRGAGIGLAIRRGSWRSTAGRSGRCFRTREARGWWCSCRVGTAAHDSAVRHSSAPHRAARVVQQDQERMGLQPCPCYPARSGRFSGPSRGGPAERHRLPAICAGRRYPAAASRTVGCREGSTAFPPASTSSRQLVTQRRTRVDTRGASVTMHTWGLPCRHIHR